jgi:hypothetical protein
MLNRIVIVQEYDLPIGRQAQRKPNSSNNAGLIKNFLITA